MPLRQKASKAYPRGSDKTGLTYFIRKQTAPKGLSTSHFLTRQPSLEVAFFFL